MIDKLTDIAQRIRRNVAQRGVRNAMNNIVRRIRAGNFSTAPAAPLVLDEVHPFDEATGLDTSGYIHGSQLQSGHPNDLYSVAYYSSSPSLAQGVLDRWRETPEIRPVEEYTFIDFGSGKGRVVLIAAKQRFRMCIGVELNPGLSAVAAENMKLWQESGNALSPMQGLCQSATEFQFPDSPCVIYLYNPFTTTVMTDFLDHIARTFSGRPGELDFLYVNPEFEILLQQHPGFARLWDADIMMNAEDSANDLLKVVDKHRNRAPGELLHEYCTAWRWIGSPTKQSVGPHD
jgi:Histone methylation protein DOT1